MDEKVKGEKAGIQQKKKKYYEGNSPEVGGEINTRIRSEANTSVKNKLLQLLLLVFWDGKHVEKVDNQGNKSKKGKQE